MVSCQVTIWNKLSSVLHTYLMPVKIWSFDSSRNSAILTDWKDAQQLYWRQGHTQGQGSLRYWRNFHLELPTNHQLDYHLLIWTLSSLSSVEQPSLLTCCVWSISHSEILSQSWLSRTITYSPPLIVENGLYMDRKCGENFRNFIIWPLSTFHWYAALVLVSSPWSDQQEWEDQFDFIS